MVFCGGGGRCGGSGEKVFEKYEKKIRVRVSALARLILKYEDTKIVSVDEFLL